MCVHGRGMVARATAGVEVPAAPSSDGGVVAEMANLLVAERFATGFVVALACGVQQPA